MKRFKPVDTRHKCAGGRNTFHSKVKKLSYESGVLALTLLIASCGVGTQPDSNSAASQNDISVSDLKYSTMEEWQGALLQCMRDAGWANATATKADWGIEDDSVTAEQRGAFESSLSDCQVQVGAAPNEIPLTDDQIRLVYHHWVKQKECLEGHGYEVSDPPSEDTFVQQAKADTVGKGWNPFHEIPPADGDLEEILQQCPQMPPGM